jgi:hypothetical protein
MISSRLAARNRRQGFALPAVLVVTAVVTLIFLVAMTALDSLNREAGAARERINFTLRAQTAEARLTWLATTEPLGSQGLRIGAPRLIDEFAPVAGTAAAARSETLLRVDGRRYGLAQLGLQLEVMDTAGLINLQRLDEEAFRRLMEAAGASTADATRLWPVFQDYIDADALRRPGGVETGDGRDLPPANRPLRGPDELLAVPGVSAVIDMDAWRRLRPELVADHTQATFNINTATPAFYRIMFAMTPAEIERALAFREPRAFISPFELRQVTGAGMVINDELVYTFPGGRFELRVQDAASRWMYRSRLVLTPTHPERPFWIDDRNVARPPLAAAASGERETDVPELPGAPN